MELRMYFLTMYNISDIQKGIQCGHAALEYALKYKDDEIFNEFVKNHKTWIILNGGVSKNSKSIYENSNQNSIGTMESSLILLNLNGIKTAEFYEPDLNNSLSSICFIVDERVFNKTLYPDYEMIVTNPLPYETWLNSIGGKKNEFLRLFLSDKKLA
jgi:hypothetical protein